MVMKLTELFVCKVKAMSESRDQNQHQRQLVSPGEAIATGDALAAMEAMGRRRDGLVACTFAECRATYRPIKLPLIVGLLSREPRYTRSTDCQPAPSSS